MKLYLLMVLVVVSCSATRRRRSNHEFGVETIQNTIKLTWSFQNPPTGSVYIVQYRKRGDTQWRDRQTRERMMLLSHLQFGASYEVQVKERAPNGRTRQTSMMQVPIPEQPEGNQESNRENANIPRPSNVQAALSGRDVVLLSWNPTTYNNGRCTYEITMRITGRTQGQRLEHNDNSAHVGNLELGQTYSFEVRSKYGGKVSYPSAVSVKLPQGNEELIKPGSIRVNFNSQDPRTVSVVWTMPQGHERLVSGYTVYHSDSMTAETWKVKRVGSATPEVNLPNIEPNKQHFVRIVTNFRDHRASTTSSTFKFITPQVVAPLIDNIKLIYNPDATMRLEWTYHDHVDPRTIEGAAVHYSQNRDEPTDRWQSVQARRGENGVTFPTPLGPNQRYFFRITPRVHGQGDVPQNTIFEIYTKGAPPTTTTGGNNIFDMRYTPKRIGADGRGDLLLQWTVPSQLERDATEITLYHTFNKNEALDRWTKVRLHRQTKQYTLASVDTTKDIFFTIAVRKRDGTIERRVYKVPAWTRQPVNREQRMEVVTMRPGELQSNANIYNMRYTPRHTSGQSQGRIMLQWMIPSSMERDITGQKIYYTYDVNQPLDRWFMVTAAREERRKIISNLDLNRDIYFRIVPETRSGPVNPRTYKTGRGAPMDHEKMMEIVSFETEFPTDNNQGNSSGRTHPPQMCMNSCTFRIDRGRKIEDTCSTGHTCVEYCGGGQRGCNKGYCMDSHMLRAAKNTS